MSLDGIHTCPLYWKNISKETVGTTVIFPLSDCLIVIVKINTSLAWLETLVRPSKNYISLRCWICLQPTLPIFAPQLFLKIKVKLHAFHLLKKTHLIFQYFTILFCNGTSRLLPFIDFLWKSDFLLLFSYRQC